MTYACCNGRATSVRLEAMRLAARSVAVTSMGAVIGACALLEDWDSFRAGASEDDAAIDAGADVQEAGSSVADACRRIAEANCNRLAACSPATVQIGFGGPATCVDMIATSCASDVTVVDARPAVASELLACANAVDRQSCTEAIDIDIPRECIGRGLRPDGDVCVSGRQCFSGYCPRGPSGCGRCEPLRAEGESCGTCAFEYVCGGGTCKRRGLMGATCNADAPCSRTLRCAAGLCAAKVAENGACGADADCDTDHGAICVRSVCRTVTYAAPGAACGYIDGAPRACTGGRCFLPDGGTASTCVASSGLGGPCNATVGQSCFPTLFCVAGQCVRPQDNLCPR